MREHILKTWPEPFEAIIEGKKTFEFRKDDREFEVGDTLVLKEWELDASINEPLDYFYFTGREHRCFVTYLLRGPAFGIPVGYVIMSIDRYHSGRVPAEVAAVTSTARERLIASGWDPEAVCTCDRPTFNGHPVPPRCGKCGKVYPPTPIVEGEP